MNIAIIGSGGRESALAWAIRKSPKCTNLYILPGNGGTGKYARNVPAKVFPPYDELMEFLTLGEIDVVVVGPEQPLVDGLVDILSRKGIKVFGPSQKAARLEGSKVYMKDFLSRYNIPTANYRVFSDPYMAIDYVREQNRPFVVKTDGLASGKGAIVNKTVDDTLSAIKRIMISKEFGAAGDSIVVEDILTGTEVSVFIASDGKDFKWLASAQDHKRIFDNDEGPNTGGMGAYAPAPFVTEAMKAIITDNIIKPTIRGLQKEGAPYTGILYIGLMITQSGPTVIEYNVRLGDPEAQVVLPLIRTDFLDIVAACMNSYLSSLKLDYYPGYCAGVVMASAGYPGKYVTGIEIVGDLSDTDNTYVFHAGTKRSLDGTSLYTDGGRVLCVSAIGVTLREAIDRAYSRVKKIYFEGASFRRDIGFRGLKHFEPK